MREYPITNQYAGQLAIGLNRYLRGEGGNDERYRPLANELNQELDSLEPFSSQVVYAHDTCTQIPFAGLSLWYSQRIGSFIQFPNFLSTSINRWAGQDSVYRIKTAELSQSRDISEVVNKPGEAEVLFKTNTIFKIEGVTDCIELSEVSLVQTDTSPITLLWFTLLDDEEVYRIYREANPISGGMSSMSD